MAVFRVEKNKGYTVMSNHHLRNKELSLKAKGLLSQMLSLPEDWDYTLAGLSLINREKIDAIREAVRELENAGYIQRSRERDEKGRLRGTTYVIYEQPPKLDLPTLEKPTLDNPTLENPMLEKPTLENPTQLNKEIQKTNLPNLETVCTKRRTIRIAGDDHPAELVKAKFMKLNSEHIRFVLDCMQENTTKINGRDISGRNIQRVG